MKYKNDFKLSQVLTKYLFNNSVEWSTAQATEFKYRYRTKNKNKKNQQNNTINKNIKRKKDAHY